MSKVSVSKRKLDTRKYQKNTKKKGETLAIIAKKYEIGFFNNLGKFGLFQKIRLTESSA